MRGKGAIRKLSVEDLREKRIRRLDPGNGNDDDDAAAALAVVLTEMDGGIGSCVCVGQEEEEEEEKRWSCPACTYSNSLEIAVCRMCGTSQPTAQWQCSACTLFNDASSLTCEACFAVRPGAHAAPQMPCNIPAVDPVNRRIVWYEGCGCTVEEFISHVTPTSTCMTNVSWIQVERDMGAHNDCSLPSSCAERVSREVLTNANREVAKGRVSRHWKEDLARRVREIATSCSLTVGKWLVFVKTEHADRVWAAVCESTAKGKLGCSSKISPTSPDSNNTLICVYCADFNNVDDCRRVLTHLFQIRSALNAPFSINNFKPDVYTYCGIYAKNDFKIPTTIFKGMLQDEAKKNSRSRSSARQSGNTWNRNSKAATRSSATSTAAAALSFSDLSSDSE